MTDDPGKAAQPAGARPTPGMDPTAAPPWWITRPTEIRDYLESLEGVEVEEIGRTAGGRPIIAAAWGEREMLPGRTCTSLASAIAGGDATAFYGKGQRERQVLMFLGAAHGTEVEGTVAALSFLNVLVTGKDLRGREQPEVAAAGRKHRFLSIPILNVDGRERLLDHVSWINCNEDYFYMVTQGLKKDGEILRWPTSKLFHPIPLDETEFLGTYNNDAGVNLVYDTPLGGDCQPETTALLRYCRRELPDCVILSHSDNGSLVLPASETIPAHYRHRVTQIGAAVGMRCTRDGLRKSAIQGPSYSHEWYQSDALYHASGALPLVVEFPMGWQNVPDTHDEILDIGLTVLEEIAAFGSRYRFRPNEPRRRG